MDTSEQIWTRREKVPAVILSPPLHSPPSSQMSAVPFTPSRLSVSETPALGEKKKKEERNVDLALKEGRLAHSATGTGCRHFPYLSRSTFRRTARAVPTQTALLAILQTKHNTHLFIPQQKTHAGKSCRPLLHAAVITRTLDSFLYNGLTSLDTCHRIPRTLGAAGKD